MMLKTNCLPGTSKVIGTTSGLGLEYEPRLVLELKLGFEARV